jgi:hypothetical protein
MQDHVCRFPRRPFQALRWIRGRVPRDPAPYPAGLLRGMLVAALWVGVRSPRLHLDALHEDGFATSVIGNAITIEDEGWRL